MKLAFLLFRYFPFGGLQRDFLRIAKACIARGHQVDVYTMAWEGEPEPGMTVHLMPKKGFQNHSRARHFYESVKPKLSVYDGVVGFNKMPGLDIYYAADTCYQAKARGQRGFWYRMTGRYRHLIDFEAAVFKSPAHILSISKMQQADFTHYYQTPVERFHLLPPGIAKDRVAPDNLTEVREKIRQGLGIKDDEYLLLMVGSGFKTKGLDRILEGVAALPNEVKQLTQLYILGSDHHESFLKQAKQLNISDNIHFLGGRHDAPQFFFAADLLLHPAYNENTGTVLLEALAAGLPVLTTDVCGYAHFIEEANAGSVLASPFNQKQFNETMATMLLSEQRKDWQNNAISFAKSADIYSMPQRAVDYIESIMQDKLR